ncbi:hypothetical protein [Streptomyces syringium]|uniref:Minor tail protein n=1 Tax=Streptomyces syringium TaxID=76729 RepID=A0ABS4Y554_9ACTN|nr:hypothetical protein [Streptomyces syringium]MBP2403572.1 hypothetical protein [Streptomyces syringium]
MNIRSAWLLNSTDADGGQTRVDTRLAPLGTMTPNGVLSSRDGVIPGSVGGNEAISGLRVFGDTAGMSAKVAPGRAVVQSTEVAGAYPVVCSEHTSVTFGDGDPGYPRVDLVVLRIYDAQQDASNQTAAVIEVVQGIPAANPVAPKTPLGSLALAEVTVPKGASSGTGGINWATAVKDRRRATVAVGGIIPLGWGLGFDGAYPGQYRDTGVGLERWDGQKWMPYPQRPSWQDYTPIWRATQGPPVNLGNGSVTGRYIQDGPIVHFRAELTIGSTTTWGGSGSNGNWYLSLPVRPVAKPVHTVNFRARIGGESNGYFHGGAEISASYEEKGVARSWSAVQASGKPTGFWVDGDDPMPPVAKNWYEVYGTYEAAV